MVCALEELLELGHGGGVLGEDGQRLVPLGLHHVGGKGGVAELVLAVETVREVVTTKIKLPESPKKGNHLDQCERRRFPSCPERLQPTYWPYWPPSEGRYTGLLR